MLKIFSRLTNLGLLGLILVMTACKGGSTEPKVEVVSADVSFIASTGCVRLDAPGRSVNMGTVEFENTSTTASISPKQLAVSLTSTSVGSVVMWMFNPEWRNQDGSITPNIDAQTDPVASYIQFGTLPTLLPGAKLLTTLKGNIPNTNPGTYSFAIIPDSVKVRTLSGDTVKVTMGASNFVLTTKASCP